MHATSPSGIPLPVIKTLNGKIVTGGTPPNTPRQGTWISDSHFHATNYTQQGYTPAQLLTAMDNLKIRYTVLSPIPTNQIACCSKKTYRPAQGMANDQPNYYIADTAIRASRFVREEEYKAIIEKTPALVYHTGVDAYTAASFRDVPEKEKDRFDPMVTGLVLGDDRASEDLLFKLEAFPGVFTGVGEITVHKEWVEKKLQDRVQPNLEDRVQSLKFLFQTCGDIGMPVILHCDVDLIPHDRQGEQPKHLLNLKALLSDPVCKNTTIVWAHAGGLGKYSRIGDGHLDRLRAMLRDPAFSHVRLDISWDTVAEQLIFSPAEIMADESRAMEGATRAPMTPDPKRVKDLVDFLEEFSGRILFGSDSLTPNSEAIWGATHKMYEVVFSALKSETRRKVELENYKEVFVSARTKVRQYERFVLPYAVIPLQMRQDNNLPKAFVTRLNAAVAVGVQYGQDCIAYERKGGKPVVPENYKGLYPAAELKALAMQMLPGNGTDLSALKLGPFEKELRPLLATPKAKL